jgi:acyl-coenzyme A synthetase/AMP-(fatty) acid ligase
VCTAVRLALWFVHADGQETKLTYSQLNSASQAAANVLARHAIHPPSLFSWKISRIGSRNLIILPDRPKITVTELCFFYNNKPQ